MSFLSGMVERYRQRSRRNKAIYDAHQVRRETRRMMRLYRHRLADEQIDELTKLLAELDQAMQNSEADVALPLNRLEERLEKMLPGLRRSPHREYAQSIGVAVMIALVLRAFVVEAFKIPSGSMIPTLQVGDYIFVNKFVYGVRVPFTDIKVAENVRKPQRGEVIVFIYPVEPDKDFIKRIAAIEGDTIEMRDNVVHINGKPIQRVEQRDECRYFDYEESTRRWSPRTCHGFAEHNGTNDYTAIQSRDRAATSFEPQTVPPGAVFVMGDNRDFSNDSRYWGFVPVNNIKGRAMLIWWSAGPGSQPTDHDAGTGLNSFFEDVPHLRTERLFTLVR